ncbi:hypothetical protein POTOM_004517 [Populus tomentosa]|uniref:BED-type domain-containing protein n=1 Tax=Populus tomentosa TaxID=118781 RepID=A0A8X8DDI7_POPTO|nr:hypothetical protein POTOM_004517 [Populus tomentosa]
MVRGRDACWEHCVLVDATRQKVRCNYCHREFSGGVYRMKFHLAQIKNKDIVPCAEVPDDVRDHIRVILSTPKKQKTPKKLRVDRAAIAQQNSSSASGGAHPNHGSSGQHGSTGPSLLFPRPSPSAQPEVDDARKKKQDDADKKIGVFFFHNSIPFSASKSIYYQEMVDAIAECGAGYRAPSYEKLRSTLLEKVKDDIHDCYKKYRDEWKETGCTILCDSWFVADYLSLRAIVIQEDNLKNMFSQSECLSSMHCRHPEAQAIKSLLYQDRFWKSAHEAVSVSEPLIKILRIVDGDMPAMGYIYEGIERAKFAIKAYYKETMIKMATTDRDKIEITKEHPIYINAQGALGTEFAIMGRTLNSPGDWWAGYGYEIPTLQRVAIKILSQPCSSHWCRWNRSTFESVHTKKRNRAELEKFNDLLFAHCNLWLQAITQSHDGKCKPIIYDEIDVSSEWPTELEPSNPLLDDSWLDNLPLDCGGIYVKESLAFALNLQQFSSPGSLRVSFQAAVVTFSCILFVDFCYLGY